MYELRKKIGKVFTSKFVGTGRALVLGKKNLPSLGFMEVEKHCSRFLELCPRDPLQNIYSFPLLFLLLLLIPPVLFKAVLMNY
jgi:hypothetical protein